MAPGSRSQAGVRHRGERTRRADALHPISSRPRLRRRYRAVLREVGPSFGRKAALEGDRGWKTKETGNGYLRGIMAKDCVAEWLQVFDSKSAPGKTRTCGLLIRSQTLYPTELRAHAFRLNKLQHRTEFRNPQFCAKNCAKSVLREPTESAENDLFTD